VNAMVHKRGIKKFKPIKLMAFDFKDNEWQVIELYPERKLVIIRRADVTEPTEVRKFKKIKNGIKR